VASSLHADSGAHVDTDAGLHSWADGELTGSSSRWSGSCITVTSLRATIAVVRVVKSWHDIVLRDMTVGC
jgi:hypothetical protein